MGEYKIGRDFQELRSRIECLEAHIGEDRTISNRRGAGVAVGHAAFSGVTADKPPVIWKPEKHEHLPPFIYSLLGVPLLEGPQYDIAGPQFDIFPQSKTWTCTPEPNILYVKWDTGGTDEFYRLENQSFTIAKYRFSSHTEVDARETATAFYYATLRASGKATNVIPGVTNNFVFEFKLTLNPGPAVWTPGFGLFYDVKCKDNYLFVCGGQFEPELYDRVSGATWDIGGDGYGVNRC
jgi:hypothetical protein